MTDTKCWCGLADHHTERDLRLGLRVEVYTYQCDRCGWKTHGLNDYLGHRCEPTEPAPGGEILAW